MVLGPPFDLISSWRERLRAAYRQDKHPDNQSTHSPLSDIHSRALIAQAPSCFDDIEELIPEFRPHWIPSFTLSSAYGCSPATRELSIYHNSSMSTRTPIVRQSTSAQLRATFSSQLRIRHAWQSTHHGIVHVDTLPSPQNWSQLPERAVREPLEHYEYPAVNPAFPPAYTVSSHQSAPTFQAPQPDTYTAPRLHRPLRLSTYRAENATSNDPPPPYQVVDPKHNLTERIRSQDSVVARAFKQVRRDGPKVTMERIGKNMVKHVGDICQTVKDIPQIIKDARQQNRAKRAKKKLFWLEKHNFMSAPDRILTHELGR
jgi:hypothetical protein